MKSIAGGGTDSFRFGTDSEASREPVNDCDCGFIVLLSMWSGRVDSICVFTNSSGFLIQFLGPLIDLRLRPPFSHVSSGYEYFFPVLDLFFDLTLGHRSNILNSA